MVNIILSTLPDEPSESASSPGEGGEQTSTQGFAERMLSVYSIFFLTFLFAGFNIFLSEFQYVSYLQRSTGFLFASIDLLAGISPLTLGSYVLFPVTFFIILYALSGRINPRKQYRAIVFALILGGASGSLVGELMGLYYQLRVVPGSVASLPGLEPVFEGLFAFFTGFSAVALSRFVKEGRNWNTGSTTDDDRIRDGFD
jgi:hypothetical protein